MMTGMTTSQPANKPANQTPVYVCVYCASSIRLDAQYMNVASQTGQLLAKHGRTLVWGGGSVGMMGAVAHAVQQHGGQVVGVIPQFMIDKELAFETADELIVTQTMRQRKQTMEDRSDYFIVLPGGFGTLEEFFEILTLRILDCHDKRIFIVNSHGFYDKLLGFIEQLYEQQFAGQKYRSCYEVVDSPETAMAMIAQQVEADGV